MKQLHEQFMGDPSTTDVLTFPIDTDEQGDVTSGEVYVCIPYARRQAKARGVDVGHEVLLYALHGMLHLLGYDDRTAADFREMHRIEDEILSAIGIGPVFWTNASRSDASHFAPGHDRGPSVKRRSLRRHRGGAR